MKKMKSSLVVTTNNLVLEGLVEYKPLRRVHNIYLREYIVEVPIEEWELRAGIEFGVDLYDTRTNSYVDCVLADTKSAFEALLQEWKETDGMRVVGTSMEIIKRYKCPSGRIGTLSDILRWIEYGHTNGIKVKTRK